MAEQGQTAGGVISFTCEHCKISLTVDESLAGITGPCPSCGQSITAPRLREPRKLELKPRAVRTRQPQASAPDGYDSPRTPVTPEERPVHRRRTISPDNSVSEAHRERAEVAAVAKMLVAGLVVLAIVMVVAYWLNHRFNA